MMIRQFYIVCAVVLTLWLVGCNQAPTPGASPTPAAPAAPAGLTDSPDSLKGLINDAMAASKANDNAKLDATIEKFILKDTKWFEETFGPEEGARLKAEYDRQISNKLAGEFRRLFAKMNKQGRTNIVVNRFDKADDPKAVGAQSDVLKAMKKPTALYSVRFIEPGEEKGQHVYNFIYQNGTFPFVGKVKWQH